MIDFSEHFYDDDPNRGHPDVRTDIDGVSYFFLGNGYIQAAVQMSAKSIGTTAGLLIMDPEKLLKKREALSFDQNTGLENTQILIHKVIDNERIIPESYCAKWDNIYNIPSVIIKWDNNEFSIDEILYCPDRSSPVLIREIRIINRTDNPANLRIATGLLETEINKEIFLNSGEQNSVFISYSLNKKTKKADLTFVPETKPGSEAIQYWIEKTQLSFNIPLLDHYFRASSCQLPAVISSTGKVDASIWQYNREWVRDHSFMVTGLVLTGHYEIAKVMLERLLKEFVSEMGDTIDSSERRAIDEVELDQNGVLLSALKNFVLWTDDYDLVNKYWKKIVALANFPLSENFRHKPSGLLSTRRDFWERHKAHGIEKGIELIHQVFVVEGLLSAAFFARYKKMDKLADLWENEAAVLKQTIFNHSDFTFVKDNILVKRLGLNGELQETITPTEEAELPDGIPLVKEKIHYLNPDSATALPIAIGFIPPESPVSKATLENIEILWNQDWDTGGHGRYNFTSEADSSGAWPFASLFIARAYMETGDYDKVWRILRWMGTIPGNISGSWFEFTGNRIAPPYPQLGVIPWTWAEMMMLMITHILGIRAEENFFRFKPKILPGIKGIKANIPIRKIKLCININVCPDVSKLSFFINSEEVKAQNGEIQIPYSQENISVEVQIPIIE